MIDRDSQAQVDAQLLEQGSFAMLDYLLDSGRLLADDHERWRRGEIETLDEVLMGSPAKIRMQLEAAAAYALRIGLERQTQNFHAWCAAAAAGAGPLLVSTDAVLRGLIVSRFAPVQTLPQLDLFFDNPVVAITNDLVRALSAGDQQAARHLVDRLYAHSPNHADLAAYDRLLALLSDTALPADPRRDMAFLLDLAPTAGRLMGSRAGDLLTPSWGRLAHALRGRPFHTGDPDLHASFACCQAQDWAGAAQAVYAEPQWWRHPALCLRLAQSGFHRRRRLDSLTAWFHLCWGNPAEVAALLDQPRQADTGIAALWQSYVDGDMASAFDAADFPAWVLIREPGLAMQLPVDLPTGATVGEERYRCVHRLIDARRSGRGDEELAQRRALMASSPALFACLKKTVATG